MPLDILMMVATFALMCLGFPVAFTLGGVALIFALLGVAVGEVELRFLGNLPHRIYGLMTREVLLAVPLFVFMGVMLERSRIAEDLIEALGRLFRQAPGGLSISVTLVGALLAASTGIVGATVVTMGLLSLPTMLRHGYDPKLACGTICAAGTLGQIIPPSIVLVFLGDFLGSAHQSAQIELGIFAAETVSVGDLFAGALVPGLLLVGLYIAYQFGVSRLQPQRCPPIPAADTGRGSTLALLSALAAPIGLMVAVLGSILGGLATPTEAASVGAIGATMLAGARFAGRGRPLILVGAAALTLLVILGAAMDLRVGRTGSTGAQQIGIAVAVGLALVGGAGVVRAFTAVWRAGVLTPVVLSAARLTSMIFTIVIGATLFTLVFRVLGGDDTVEGVLQAMPGGAVGAVALVMLAMFLMGFFLDFVEITLLVVPIVAPILLVQGVDPIWLGVMMAINLQTSFLTPPFGFALFYLRGVAPETVRTTEIYRGALPFIGLQVLGLGLVAAVPELATWLPDVLFD